MDAIEVDEPNEAVFLDRDNCIGCGVCVTACKPVAINLARREVAA